MGMAHEKLGWFHTKRRLGDRSIEQQMEGLDRLVQAVPGKTVLDIGCAEGLITARLIDAGAIAGHGVEIIASHVKTANKIRKGRAINFEIGDANNWQPKRQYDIVIMLAVLHKLRDPSEATKRFADTARELVVIRLPPSGSLVLDERSDFVPHDIEIAMTEAGWCLDEVVRGPIDEWVGYFLKA